MLTFIFWMSVLLVFYAYIGYPLLLLGIGKFKPRPVQRHNPFTPSVSIIVPVYNEEKIIADKLANLLTISYPKEKLEIIVISDSSNDGTDQIVLDFDDSRIRFSALPQRSGKAAALNKGLEISSNQIVVFTDASIFLEDEALQNLVGPFQDITVGVVSGEDYITGASSEGFYGRYELFLRNLESRVDSIVGASGCLYAQRRSICQPFPQGMAPDFFSVLISVEQGFRCITEPLARGRMGHVKKAEHEYQRKVRTLLRGITTLAAFPNLFNPSRYGFFSVALISHKPLRWLVGLFLIAAFISNLLLIQQLFYSLLFCMQLLFYGLSIAGLKRSQSDSMPITLRLPFFFCLANISALKAIWLFINGHRQEIWEPSRR